MWLRDCGVSKARTTSCSPGSPATQRLPPGPRWLSKAWSMGCSASSALRITDEQFARIKAIGRKDYSAWNREAASAFRKDRDFPAYQRRLAENRSRRDREQAAVLTPEQRAQWERMLGDPFQGPTPGPILVPAVARGPGGERPGPAVGRGAPPTAEAEPGNPVVLLARTVESLGREV